jgi:hypothetical protein
MSHRNGQLRFLFNEIELPAGVEPPATETRRSGSPQVEASAAETRQFATRQVEARLESVDVDHKEGVQMDEEGGTKVASSKKRFIAPVATTFLAGMGLDHDRIKSHGVQTGEYGSNAGGRAVSGGVGFGLIGSALGQISRPFAVSLGYYSAAWSIYSNVIARGTEVSFPAQTRIEIRFGSRAGKPKN